MKRPIIFFLNNQWSSLEKDLLNGESVLLHAPKNYGKRVFLDDFNQRHPKKKFILLELPQDDSGSINYSSLWKSVTKHFKTTIRKKCETKNDFLNNMVTLLGKFTLNIAVKSNSFNVNNVATFVSVFQEIKFTRGNLLIDNFSLIIFDDFSLYFYEYDATENRSIFDFLKRYHFGINTDRVSILNALDTLSSGSINVESIAEVIFEVSGGNDGIIIEIFSSVIKDKIINDLEVFREQINLALLKSNHIAFINRALSANKDDFKDILAKYRSKRFIDTKCNPTARKLYSSGIILLINTIYSIRCTGFIDSMIENLYNRKLIIFLHGLGGNQNTWNHFKRIIEKDTDLINEFAVTYYLYPTSILYASYFFFKKMPSIEALGRGLKAEIDAKYGDYNDISLVCHSLGGLVAKEYLLQEFMSERIISKIRVKRLLTYATPHNGATLANVGIKLVKWNRQIKQLCKDSTYINNLNDQWEKFEIVKKIKVQYIIAALDGIVDEGSSEGNHPDRTYMSIDTNHFTIIKPDNSSSLQYRIFKSFLES